MEVLQALVLKANLDAGTAEPSPVLAQVLETDQSFETVILTSEIMKNIQGEERLHCKPGRGSQARGGQDAAGGGRGSWQGRG